MGKTSKSGANFIERTGQSFGRWTVLARTRQLKHVRWICLCDCGTLRDISSNDLQSGRTNSCGCLRKDRTGQTIPARHRREYNSWSAMKQRCYYPEHLEFHRYGGRGIQICERWRNSFLAFLEDMGQCPKGFSIERVANDGNYEPGNCRWASQTEQMSNTVLNVFVDYGGEKLTLKQLAGKLGLSYYRLHAYYRRRGLTLETAIARASKPGINRPYRWKPTAIPA